MSRPTVPTCPVLSTQDRALVATLIVGVILPLLDTTLVNIALHSIGEALGASIEKMQWVVAGYTLSAAAAVPLCSWLTQRLGSRRLWVLCLWLFLGGASLSALAQSVEFLIFARVLQGVATGLLLPTMQSIVIMHIGREKARLALAAVSVPSVLAPILGPVIGGISLEHVGWRPLFWAHVPICILAIALASSRLPSRRQDTREKLDSAGLLLLLPGVVLVIFGLSLVSHENKGTWVGLLGMGLVLMTGFVLHARRKQGTAIVDLSVLGMRSTQAAFLLLFFSSVAYYGGILLFPLYLIQAGGYGPTWAGLLVALHGVGILLARRKLTQASLRWGDRRVAAAAVAAGLAGSALLLTPCVLEHAVWMATGMVLRGAGIGVLTLLSMSAAYQGLKPSQVMHASSLSRIVTHLGATIGATTVAGIAAGKVAVDSPSVTGFVLAQLVLVGFLMACGVACGHLRAGNVAASPEGGGEDAGARRHL